MPRRTPRPADARARGASVRLDDHHRQLHPERRALSLAVARAPHGAAVHLDQLPHDREAEPEPAALARDAAVRLAEALEHVRQELGAMPMPVSLTTISTCEFDPLDAHLHPRRRAA